MNPKKLFKDQNLQDEIDKKGFVTLPFIGEAELEAIRSFYHEIHPTGAPEKIQGIHMTTWCENLEYKMNVTKRLEEIYRKRCEEVFEDFRVLNNVFIVKDKGDTQFSVHQDWTIVDERENFALNVWVPLYDVTQNEGGLWIVDGSHTVNRHIRGSAYLNIDYSQHRDKLQRASSEIRLKAGEAVVFYMNAIHGSFPNLTDFERIVTCFAVIPEEAPLTIFYQKAYGDSLEMHSPKDDFLYHYKDLRKESAERPPSDKPVEVLESFVNKAITEDELTFLVRKKEKSPWWKFGFSRG